MTADLGVTSDGYAASRAGLPLLSCPRTTILPSVPAVTRSCDTCGHSVWVSKVMVPVVDGEEIAPCCEPCIARRVRAGQRIEPVRHFAQAAAGMTPASFAGMSTRWIAHMRRLADG